MGCLTRIARWGVIAALALATGCSGEQSLSEQYPTQWKTCNALLGTGNMESLREIVDSDDLRFSRRSLPVEQIQKGLTREAIEPYDEYKGFDEYEVCGLSGDGQFKAMAMWAADNLRAVQADTELWHRAAEDVYVANTSYVVGDVNLLFRCDIKGAGEQQKQVLIETRITTPGNRKALVDLRRRLIVHLSRALRDELACTNRPDILSDLAIGG
ncbi:hypothetical protein ACWGH3_03755 [Streptomyces sp. NPDC054884]